MISYKELSYICQKDCEQILPIGKAESKRRKAIENPRATLRSASG